MRAFRFACFFPRCVALCACLTLYCVAKCARASVVLVSPFIVFSRFLSVREKSKQLVELLNDTSRIREERAKTRELRSKYVGIGQEGSMSHGCTCYCYVLRIDS